MPNAESMEMGDAGQKKPQQKKGNSKLCVVLLLLLLIAGGVGAALAIVLGRNGNWIKGTWSTNFGSYVTITESGDYWISVSSWGASVYRIDQITPGYAIMQNPSTDAYNPDLWTKSEFHTTEGDKWGYCSTVYNGASKQAAIDADTSEIYKPSDTEKGCNGFGFTVMSPYANPVLGSWADNFGATITINATHWKSEASWGTSEYAILAYGDSFVLMQNPSSDAYNPDKWTRVKFHPSTTGGSVADGFGFCMAVYNGETMAAALAADLSTIYDASDAAAGCNGFQHSVASPA